VSHDAVIVILAGGMGRRLWPLSTAERPKQFVPLFAGKSMLQNTFERAAAVVGADAVLLVGNLHHRDLYVEQLPELLTENLILEPEGRGTAAALALTVAICAEAAPGAAIATIPSDHVIPKPAEWIEAVRTGLDFARDNELVVCLGATPRPGETKFGYVIAGETIGGSQSHPVKMVRQFHEKPDAATLEDLMSRGSCLRNMGTLLFQPRVLASEMERLAPAIYSRISESANDSPAMLERAYAEVPTGSIDELVLQRSERLAVVSGRIESTDAGDFASLGDAVGRDDRGNASTGRVISVDSSNNTVFSDNATVALVGVSGLVVVVEGDRILVCPAEESQRIKEISEDT
jgi:mannose-1-phosphate guanylyltransferase/mannose-6-phosphate isomerase